jgi:hypothetical protein
MAMHKLLVDDFCDTAFSLIAVHCRLEDYRMAYLINKYLNLKLKRCQLDLDVNNFSSSYAVYEWEEAEVYTSWHLISNVCRKEEDALQSSGSLFQEQQKILKTYHLIPELKKVDFLLKIQSEALEVNERKIVSGLQQIPQVITAYSVTQESIKTKDCLIIN